MTSDLMNKIVSLCKRRGFVFQSSEIYGGLKSCYDYGPLGVAMKRNIAQLWWDQMVTKRDDVVGIDASIIMHPKVWEASGHLANFSDPLVDCLNCKERFRADKAPKKPQGSQVTYKKGGKSSGETLSAVVPSREILCPQCGSPDLSEERRFMGMFRTTLGPIEPLSDGVEALYDQGLSKEEFKEKLMGYMERASVYLRPETAQAMFVQFLNIQQTMSMKVPFGIAQQGKSFRNEIIVEHFIFRSCEFEQMEMEFFCEPGTQGTWMEYWKKERMNWYLSLSNTPESFRLRAHAEDELAHYSDQCFDIEYEFPWGWGELEGIASRTDYDLKKHGQMSKTKLSYFDPQKVDPETGKTGWRYIPYVIEPAAGLTRTMLCLLCDAYREEEIKSEDSESKVRVYLKLHPKIAPYKAAICPLVKKDGQPEKAKELLSLFQKAGLPVAYDENQSIGKRYAKHDEIGTPFAITIDPQTLTDGTVTIRKRDCMSQSRVTFDEAVSLVKDALA